ncbi:MAG: multidrug transporter [Chloroflexi bacterium]|nr:MAG: multidrug transporter [Chloroflexota bacterium]
MRRYVIRDDNHVPPFNEPARELTIGTRSLTIHHEAVFLNYFQDGCELGGEFDSADERVMIQDAAIVYRESLWFDNEFLAYFVEHARETGQACRAAIRVDDPAFRTYTLKLARNFTLGYDAENNRIALIELWYYPNGYVHDDEVLPIVVPSDAEEKGFYSVPDFMAQEQGNLTHFLPERAILSIESWVHVYYASIIFGVFARGSRKEEYIKQHNFYALKVLWHAIIEQKQMLSTSELVQVGKGTVIHPSAQISGPTTIGENCFIGPGVVIDNCSIGDNVSIDQGCQLMLSTVANNCFLPFRAALYLTSVMEHTIIAQNTCLQMCVVGRQTFIGAGNTFTDFILVGKAKGEGDDTAATRTVPRPIRTFDQDGNLQDVGQVVLGSAVGHNCRIGSGLIFFPGRMIESDVVLIASPQRRVIERNVRYEESDHHYISGGLGANDHPRRYRRKDEEEKAEAEGWEIW